MRIPGQIISFECLIKRVIGKRMPLDPPPKKNNCLYIWNSKMYNSFSPLPSPTKCVLTQPLILPIIIFGYTLTCSFHSYDLAFAVWLANFHFSLSCFSFLLKYLLKTIQDNRVDLLRWDVGIKINWSLLLCQSLRPS